MGGVRTRGFGSSVSSVSALGVPGLVLASPISYGSQRWTLLAARSSAHPPHAALQICHQLLLPFDFGEFFMLLAFPLPVWSALIGPQSLACLFLLSVSLMQQKFLVLVKSN